MTDKQITNEIDISKCEFCGDSGYCYIYSGTASFKWMCKENEDCQIKNLLLQLKSKEQECQQAMDNYVQLDLQRVKEYNELVDLYKAKEQECEELKNTITNPENIRDKFSAKLDQLKAENDALKEKIKAYYEVYSNHDVLNERNKLKQTLAEIKELLLKTPTDSQMHCVNVKSVILQKISECEI